MSLVFPWDDAPAAAQIRPVAPGISWLRFPLPFALDHVNVWLLDSPSGPVIVDAGIKSFESRSIWQDVLGSLPRPPAGLLVTHYHPDHVGMAGWLSRQLDIPVWFSKRDLEYASEAFAISDADFSAAQDSWYQLNGLDSERRAVMHSAGNTFRPNVHELPTSRQLLSHGDSLAVTDPAWQVMTAGGHAPEMICLYSTVLNILIVADQVLPSITPNVSLNHYTQDNNPLASFLNSFSLFEAIPEDVLVLPSHGLPFRGLHTRIAQLRDHHEERFTRLVNACKTPSTAADMLPVMFHRQLDYQQLMFAMGESVAHLRFLDLAGQLDSIAEAGEIRYSVC